MVNKKIFNVSIAGCFLSLFAMILIEYFPSGIIKCNFISGHRGFFESVAIGIFTGMLVTVVSSRIMYQNHVNDLAAKLSAHLMYMRFYLSHLNSKVDYTKVDSDIILDREIDFSLGFYDKIISECDELRRNLELKFIFESNMELYDKILGEIGNLRQYCASISRDMRHPVNNNQKQLLLSGINVKVEFYLKQLKDLLMEFGIMGNFKGEKLKEYESVIDGFVVKDE